MSLDVSKFDSNINECEMFNAKEFVLIGISLGNSFFNEERLELIIRGFSTNFRRVAVLLVDKLSEHNYRAMGYSEAKIEKKVRRNGNLTINRITRAIERTNEIYSKNNIELYRWSDIEAFDGYDEALEKVIQIYEKNGKFHDTIYETTRSVIEQYLQKQYEDAFFEEAKWYFLKEVAMGCCVHDFFNESSVLTCYYQDFRFYREFFENQKYIKIDTGVNAQELLIYHCNED